MASEDLASAGSNTSLLSPPTKFDPIVGNSNREKLSGDYGFYSNLERRFIRSGMTMRTFITRGCILDRPPPSSQGKRARLGFCLSVSLQMSPLGCYVSQAAL
jgi:hypothetical protein